MLASLLWQGVAACILGVAEEIALLFSVWASKDPANTATVSTAVRSR